jgi:hypothetical protein
VEFGKLNDLLAYIKHSTIRNDIKTSTAILTIGQRIQTSSPNAIGMFTNDKTDHVTSPGWLASKGGTITRVNGDVSINCSKRLQI